MNFTRRTLKRVGYAFVSATFTVAIAGLQVSAAIQSIELAQTTSTPTPTVPEATPEATPEAAPVTPAAPATPTPPPTAPTAPPTREAAPAAQETGDTPLYERTSYINGCRQATATTEIFLNTALGPVNQRVGTVTTGTQVTLTGVLGTITGIGGVAQIKQPVVGWVRAANLTTCDDGGLPGKGTCYVVRRTNAPNGLSAYDNPGRDPQRYPNRPTGAQDGPDAGSRVYLTNPPTAAQTYNGKVFVKVYYTSLSGGERLGWVSQGTVGSVIGSPTSNFQPCN
jgi:hypothetical protein